MALTEIFPGERASTSIDNVAKHGAKLEKRKLCAVRERVSEFVFPGRCQSTRWTRSICQVGEGWRLNRSLHCGEG